MVKTASISQIDPAVDTFYTYTVTITNSSNGPVSIDFNDPLPCGPINGGAFPANAASCSTTLFAPNATTQNPPNPSFCVSTTIPAAGLNCNNGANTQHGVRFQAVSATNGLTCAASVGASVVNGVITCGGTLAGNTSSVITESVSVRGNSNPGGGAGNPSGPDIASPPQGTCAPITNTATLSAPAAPIVTNPNAANTISILGCANTTPPSTSTPIPTAFPTNTPAPTSTTGAVPAADIDVIFTDNPLAGSTPASAACGGTGDKPAAQNGATPSCSAARINVFNDSSTAFTGVVYTVTLTSPAGDTQAAPAAGVIVGGGVGWACPVNPFSATTTIWTCTGNLAPKAGGTGTNAPDANPNGSSVIIDLFNSLAANQTVAGNWTWSSTVTCGSPTPCTSGTVSAGNGDGSVLVISDTDPIFASDLDGGGAAASNPTVAQYAVGAGNPGAVGQFVWFNDGPQPIGALTVSGSLVASGTTTITQLTAAPTAGFSGLMTCSATITGSQTGTWTCSGALTADTGTQGDNTGGGDVNSYAFITITAKGVGVAGNTVTFTPNAPVCTAPGACVSGVVGPANDDGLSTATTPPTVTSTIS